jgi:uncharacterized protein (DUF3084 family)
MQRKRIISGLTISSILLAFVLFLGSCSNKITEEQLAQLKELRKESRSLSEQIDKRKGEKSKLESELKARQAELKKCQDQVDFIKQKLALWPDIWPDWKPDADMK